MEDLIDRLEAATNGNCLLDWYVAGCPYWDDCADGIARPNYNNPPYTTSLDAALTLVPEGMDWSVVLRTRHPYRGLYDGEAVIWNVRQQGFGHTPILALCVAALKARNTADNQTWEHSCA